VLRYLLLLLFGFVFLAAFVSHAAPFGDYQPRAGRDGVQ
jgi:hypothetical protein